MRKLITLAAVSVLALSLGGCNFQTFQSAFTTDVQAVEAKIATLIAKIKAAAPIVLSDIQTGISLACSIAPVLNNGVADLNSSLSNPGPKATAAIATAASYATAAQQSCNAYNAAQASSAQSLGSATTTLVGLWNAYVAGKSSLSTAQQAVASNQ